MVHSFFCAGLFGLALRCAFFCSVPVAGRDMSSTPRAKPMVAKEGASPRASAAPANAKGAGEKKPKAKKAAGKAPSAPIGLGMPMKKPDELTEEQAKQEVTEFMAEALPSIIATLRENFLLLQA